MSKREDTLIEIFEEALNSIDENVHLENNHDRACYLLGYLDSDCSGIKITVKQRS